jgi:hypothetical protein
MNCGATLTRVALQAEVLPIQADAPNLAHVETIKQSIVVMRGQRVLPDAVLARLYGVPTKALNQAVKRNLARFPPDFAFRVAAADLNDSDRSQNVTGSQRHRNPRHAPLVFTEHGALMAATVLNSPRAVEMSVFIVRAFVQLRGLLAANAQLERQLDELERKYRDHDEAIAAILAAIRNLMTDQSQKGRGIGFTAEIS